MLTRYAEDNGTTYDCFIENISSQPSEGRVNVQAIWYTGDSDGQPFTRTHGPVQYDIKRGMVVSDPCVPPGMQDPDAAQEPDGDKDDA